MHIDNSNWSACAAPAVAGTGFCVMHTKGLARQLGQKGGRSGRALPGPLKELTAPKTPSEVGLFLAQVLIEVRDSRITPKTANAAAVVAATVLRSFETAKAVRKTLADVLDTIEDEDEVTT